MKLDDIDDFFPFDEYRPHQKEITEFIINEFYNEEKKFCIAEAPTGIGKSAIAYTVGSFVIDQIEREKIIEQIQTNVGDDGEEKKTKPTDPGPRIIICTGTRQLQQQYNETFENSEVLWSAAHYGCKLYPEEEGWYYGSAACVQDSCPYKRSCTYKIERDEFMSSDIGILNYHFFLNNLDLRPQLLIMDEAHNIEDILCEILSIEITEKTLRKIFNTAHKYGIARFKKHEIDSLVEPITKIEDLGDKETSKILYGYREELRFLKKEAKELLGAMKALVKTLKEHLPSKTKKKMSALAYLDRLASSTIGKIEIFLANDVKIGQRRGYMELIKDANQSGDETKNYEAAIKELKVIEWVLASQGEYGIKVKPLHIDEMAQENLLNRADRMLFMSATICGPEQFTEELGIERKDYSFVSVPAVIPRESRVVYSIPAGSMSNKTIKEVLPDLVATMDSIVNKLEDSRGTMRGIIHSVSYKNAQTIKELSEHGKRMIIPDGREIMNVVEVLERYDNTIVVSPRIMEGVDLVGDLSRFQFFPKVPYPFLGDEWIKSKMKNNQAWYSRQTIIKMVQGAGRSIRSEDDWAFTFILDSNFRRLYGMSNGMFPVWFKEAVTLVESL
ncbi:MAG: hypothetical protein KAS32_25660 [Candidatus Peribacteraceae bacterium]|nr:hypothetical protein [Candidatus Peribacteraceae bacterium]